MKTLTVFRHAKSSWEFTDLQDHERPLLEKGEKRTKRSCNWLKENSFFPDKIISSPAKRAISTADLLIKYLKKNIEIELNSSLYPGTQEQIAEVLVNVPNSCNHILIVGHNPGFTDIVNELLNEENIEWMPTSGFAILNFEIDNWNQILDVQADLVHYIEPKNLK